MGTAKTKLRTTSTNGHRPIDVVRSPVLAFPSGLNRTDTPRLRTPAVARPTFSPLGSIA